MVSPMRSERTTGETYVPDPMGPTNPGDMLSSPTEENADAVEKNSPAMIFLPSQSTREVLNEMIDATNNGVALTGAAATGSMGPLIGKVEIGELKDSYYFRVSLPGVSMDKREFNCVIRADGKVTIQGILTTGEQIVSNKSGVFRMLTQNLGPPGPFTVSFRLPGPVNNQEVKSHLACGFLEAIVKKM
ncbi:hypothetical protein ERO13_D08G227800v2 [Gossypium hirsutum]|uniref:Alpha-crystallin domain-containing protein 22.3 isoform X2 n=1 Tax=Gossypium hirsutum TaxID=3635 RepID=A0A1U8IPZ9_GOSHI|nr:alpha-crystallin domain-containing protein 22.3 isoform X2 [Gossypium hirsutum]KAG4135621.1 hypothetical protein ERO13_D08G227800v2 [Gossypium hirsutum]